MRREGYWAEWQGKERISQKSNQGANGGTEEGSDHGSTVTQKLLCTGPYGRSGETKTITGKKTKTWEIPLRLCQTACGRQQMCAKGSLVWHRNVTFWVWWKSPQATVPITLSSPWWRWHGLGTPFNRRDWQSSWNWGTDGWNQIQGSSRGKTCFSLQKTWDWRVDLAAR